MNRNRAPMASPTFLGIECGASHTVAVLADAAAQPLRRAKAGPANLQLLSDGQLVRHLRSLQAEFAPPSAIAIGMAGARTEADHERIRRAAARVWPGVPCSATSDLETALMAADIEPPGARHSARRFPRSPQVRVLVLSGTGSCCFGRGPSGRTLRVGGWGHLLGDRGSGYDIGLRALQVVIDWLDRDGVMPELGQRILRVLQLNEPEELVAWAHSAAKADIAALAVEVFHRWKQRDPIAADVLAGAASRLATDAAACARRLMKGRATVQFVFAGGVLVHQPRFAALVAKKLRPLWPRASMTLLKQESVWGAVALARSLGSKFKVQSSKSDTARPGNDPPRELMPLRSLALSPTEQRHPRSMNLDKLPLREAIALMLSEEAKIPAAILAERNKLERAIALIVRAFRRGGRLFYVGAGTSGRLGVLDASECPPTFSVPPEMVQGVMAGGQRALWQSVEGAEDDASAGARAVEFRSVERCDVVVGIAASGRTPFVWGALGEARKRGAVTVLLCFNPTLQIPSAIRPRVVITPNVGPEILTGSTRLKAGTATKLVLNLFTTLAMVRLGKVASNLMVDVQASNTKLRDRATRIVQELTGATYDAARAALEKSRWKIKVACARLKRSRRARPDAFKPGPHKRV